MAGYLGTKAVLLSTTAADVTGNAEIGGDLTVGGNLTSTGIDDNAAATAVTIDSSGNVGIGVTPENSSGTWRNFEQGGMNIAARSNGAIDGIVGTNYVFKTNNSEVYKNTGAASRLFFNNGVMQFQNAASGTADTAITWSEVMRINNSGNLLAGKTVANTTTKGVWIDGPNGRLFATADDDYTAQFTRNGSDGVLVYWYNDTAQAGTITISGSSCSYNTSSDYRLKTDVQPMAGASARVQALKPVNFEWIANGTRVDGFLAHEAQAVVPESVTGTKDAMRDEEYEVTPAVLDNDGNVVTEAVMGTRSVPDHQGIDQSKLVPLLTAALQEALTEITDLKARVTALEVTP